MRRAIAVVLAACSSSAPPPPAAPPAARWSGSLSPAPAEGADVVATIDGERIYVADVELQARAAGQTPEQALAELEAATLLAEEAARRGLADDPDVADARRRASVRALLARAFEPTFPGPEAIPQEEVEAIYRMPRIHAYYDHEEYHTCDYARVEVPEHAPPDEVERARVRAEAVYQAVVAAHPTTKKAFFAAVHAAGLAAQDNQEYSTTRTHGPAVPEFAAAAYSVSQPGEVARPVRTQWGWDILYLESIITERHTPRAEAEADIRKSRFEIERQAAFKAWVDRLVAAHQIVKSEPHLETVQVDSLVGLP